MLASTRLISIPAHLTDQVGQATSTDNGAVDAFSSSLEAPFVSEPEDTHMAQQCSADILSKPDSLDVSCKPRFFLDLFSGAKAPVSTAGKKHLVDMFEPIDIIHDHDLLDDDKFFEAMMLAESGLIGAGVAAPFCCKHSRATLRRPGPRPVRTPEFLDGVPSNSVARQLSVQESSLIHGRSRFILSAINRGGGLIILENPGSSMTWLDDHMVAWVHSEAPYAAHAHACQFDVDRAKVWCFVSNRSEISMLARSCTHGPKAHMSIVGQRLPDGAFLSRLRLRAEYPPSLAAALATLVSQFTSCKGRLLTLPQWRSMIPVGPTLTSRIEDGGGLPSTTLQGATQSSNFDQLREAWFQRLCNSKDCLKIFAHLQKRSRDPPLTKTELSPYIADMVKWLGLQDHADDVLAVTPGQPLRLKLLKHLALAMRGPDVQFLDTLQVGVTLGVNEQLQPSPAWPLNTDCTSEPVPLQDCTSSWKSARDNHSLVQDLVQDEVQSGFVAHVPGGIEELKSKFKRTAVGKLGVVITEGRAPRLVVDSSISNVTANTVLPNHMLLPRINDIIIRCTPTEMPQDQLIQLTRDVSKAHRRILIHPVDQGLLCFHVGDQLYRCLTLNFGARASGFYWSRVAGLMVRVGHCLLDHHHTLWQYVDDLLAWLHRQSATLWSSALVILYMILGAPFSWHKAALAQQLAWIGWTICVRTWTVQIPAEKLSKIYTQIHNILKSTHVDVKDLQSVVGRLLWLTAAWHHLRPLQIPLYKALRTIPTTMVGIDQVSCASLLDMVSENLLLTSSLTSLHHSLNPGTMWPTRLWLPRRIWRRFMCNHADFGWEWLTRHHLPDGLSCL